MSKQDNPIEAADIKRGFLYYDKFGRFTGLPLDAFWQVIFDGHFHFDWRTKNIRSDERRGGEVKEWLSRHPEVVDYVILDDDRDFTAEQKTNHCVFTDDIEGMLFKHKDALRTRCGIKTFSRDGDIWVLPLPNETPNSS